MNSGRSSREVSSVVLPALLAAIMLAAWLLGSWLGSMIPTGARPIVVVCNGTTTTLTQSGGTVSC